MSFSLNGKKVLITGAAMGMGRLYALKAAQEKARVIILWDINKEALEQTAQEVRTIGSKVDINVVDLSKLESIEKAVKEFNASEDDSRLDVLINNAGVVSGNKFFWENDNIKDIYFTISVNSLAPMYITKLLIKEMILDKPNEKRILNISSAAATVANPRMAAYCASKWALLGWSDSLRLELLGSGNEHVKLTTFCPTYISTGMFAGAKSLLFTPIITPEKAVNCAWHAMKIGRPIQYMPWTTRLAVATRGILPVKVWDWVALHIFKIYSSMDDFKGRENTSKNT